MKPLSRTRYVSFISLCIFFHSISYTQTIGTFSYVAPTTQTQNLVLPSTHTFQRIIKTGDALSLGGTVGQNLDFTGYVPISGSSRNGYLSISNETSGAANIAMLGINYNTSTHTWVVNSGGNVFNAAVITQIGTVSRFCSGTVTPNNTIMVSEEDISGADDNADGYTDRGWIIEVDPATRTVMESDGTHSGRDKLWAIGRASRENAAIKSDNSILYTGGDNGTNGYLYKFVPTVPGNFSAGSLYVLRTSVALGSGTWKLLPNTTQTERNTTITLAAAAPAAYNFNGIEDVEFGPDGKIYFTAKSEGKIYRFTDNGTYGTATDISGLEVFAGNDAYPTIRSYDVNPGAPIVNEPWGRGNDNLAFDGEGNLWVCQDAIVGTDRNHIWVIGPGHTQASPQVRVFATTPTRSEPTGITFSPDYKFMFISFMNPTTSNTSSQLDAANTGVIFNTHTTVVIARREHLGSTSTLPLTFTAFDAKQTGTDVTVSWSVADINNHDFFSIERSVNGTDFLEIARNNESINGLPTRSFTVADNNLPAVTTLYYRIKQCDLNGDCKYTEIKTLRLNATVKITRLFPQPAGNKLNVLYNSNGEGAGTGLVTVTDLNGKIILKQVCNIIKGTQTIEVKTNQLMKGNYLLTVTDKNFERTTQMFMKE